MWRGIDGVRSVIRSALRTVVAALTALALAIGVFGFALCIRLWKDARRPRAFVLLAGLAFAGCAGSTGLRVQALGPVSPDFYHWWEPVERAPTTMHSFIYEMMERCVNISGDFASIRWISADFVLHSFYYQRLGGLWVKERRLIVLAAEKFNSPPEVSEEILHSLLTGTNTDHDDPDFQRCKIKRLVPVGPE